MSKAEAMARNIRCCKYFYVIRLSQINAHEFTSSFPILKKKESKSVLKIMQNLLKIKHFRVKNNGIESGVTFLFVAYR